MEPITFFRFFLVSMMVSTSFISPHSFNQPMDNNNINKNTRNNKGRSYTMQDTSEPTNHIAHCCAHHFVNVINRMKRNVSSHIQMSQLSLSLSLTFSFFALLLNEFAKRTKPHHTQDRFLLFFLSLSPILFSFCILFDSNIYRLIAFRFHFFEFSVCL